jgi:hypothetical protein
MIILKVLKEKHEMNIFIKLKEILNEKKKMKD